MVWYAGGGGGSAWQYAVIILFRFLGFGDFKILICHRNLDIGPLLEGNVQWCNEF